MIGVLTTHWAKEGKVKAARTLLDGNGMAKSYYDLFEIDLALP